MPLCLPDAGVGRFPGAMSERMTCLESCACQGVLEFKLVAATIMQNATTVRCPHFEALFNVIVVEQADGELGNNQNLLQGVGTPKRNRVELDPIAGERSLLGGAANGKLG